MTINFHTDTTATARYLHTLRSTLKVSGDRPNDLPQKQNRALLRLEESLWNHEKHTPEDMTAIGKAFDAAQTAFAEYITFPAWPDGIPAPVPVESDEDLGMLPLPATHHFSVGLSDRAWRVGKIYEDYSREVSPEGFEEFHETCFMGMLSVIAKRRIEIPFSTPDYTSLMTILAADTSISKTTTAKVVVTVLEAARLDWMIEYEKPTPQKMIYEMAGHVPTDYDTMNLPLQQQTQQKLAFSGQRGQIIGEFGKFVKSMMNEKGPYAEFEDFLLQMDDGLPKYGNSTIQRGSDMIEHPFFALLACMTPASIKTSAKSNGEFWGNGFWPRFNVSCPPEDFDIDKPFELGKVPVPYELSKSLAAWHRRLGTRSISIEPRCETNQKGESVPIKGAYNIERGELPQVAVTFGAGVHDAYKRYRTALKQLAKQMRTRDLKGNYHRLAGKAMRVAALLASLENDNCVEIWHWAKAQEICERWRRSLHRLYAQINDRQESKGRKIEDAILDVLKRKADEGIMEMTAGEIKRASNFLNNNGRSQKDTNDALYQMQRAGTVDYSGNSKKYSLPSMKKVTKTPGQGVPKTLDTDLDISFDEAM